MKNKLKFILPIGIVLIAAVVILIVFLQREESYRVIKVSNIDGQAEVVREDIGLLNAYEGMILQSEDSVTVEAESYLYLKLDEDKYVMLEPGTKMQLKASGNGANSKTSIYLEAGAVVTRLDNKLSEESVYEISTPNSTMAVRGTVFRVEVGIKEDGTAQTQLSVFEGEVACQLSQPDGTLEDEIILVANDQNIVIHSDAENTILQNTPEDVEYEELTKRILEFILKSIDEQEDSEVSEETEELIRDLLADKEPTEYTVTFRYQEKVFATQIVKNGEYATAPLLLPAATGSWNFDFTKPVLEDTIIDWIE